MQAFLQTLVNDLSTLGSTSDEQIKALENTCVKEFRDLSLDRIRRMIRSVLKVLPMIHIDYLLIELSRIIQQRLHHRPMIDRIQMRIRIKRIDQIRRQIILQQNR